MQSKIIPFPRRLDPKTQAEFDRLRKALLEIDKFIALTEQSATAYSEKPNQSLADWAKYAFIHQEGMFWWQSRKIEMLAAIVDLLGIDRTRSPNVMPGEYR